MLGIQLCHKIIFTKVLSFYGMSSVAILYVEIYMLYIEIFMGQNIYLWTKKNIYVLKRIFVDIKIYLWTKKIFMC